MKMTNIIGTTKECVRSQTGGKEMKRISLFTLLWLVACFSCYMGGAQSTLWALKSEVDFHERQRIRLAKDAASLRDDFTKFAKDIANFEGEQKLIASGDVKVDVNYVIRTADRGARALEVMRKAAINGYADGPEASPKNWTLGKKVKPDSNNDVQIEVDPNSQGEVIQINLVEAKNDT